MAATVNYVYGFDVTARVAEPWMYEGMRDAYVADAGSRAFLERANPWALRDIAGRLLEAADRGRWQPDASSRAELERLWGTALQPNPGLVPVRVRPAAGESPG
jgi:cobaltochelatase CobN